MFFVFLRHKTLVGAFVALLLAGCGSTPSGLPNASAGTTTPAGVVTPTSAYNGCPAKQIPVDTSSQADIVVTDQGAALHQPISLHVGQTLEVRLRASVIWQLVKTDAGHALQAAEPQGWYDGSAETCVWRFAASATGTVTLNFSGGLLCAPNSACPAIAAVQDYAVTVS
jgi:hypothetical protein